MRATSRLACGALGLPGLRPSAPCRFASAWSYCLASICPLASETASCTGSSSGAGGGVGATGGAGAGGSGAAAAAVFAAALSSLPPCWPPTVCPVSRWWLARRRDRRRSGRRGCGVGGGVSSAWPRRDGGQELVRWAGGCRSSQGPALRRRSAAAPAVPAPAALRRPASWRVPAGCRSISRTRNPRWQSRGGGCPRRSRSWSFLLPARLRLRDRGLRLRLRLGCGCRRQRTELAWPPMPPGSPPIPPSSRQRLGTPLDGRAAR